MSSCSSSLLSISNNQPVRFTFTYLGNTTHEENPRFYSQDRKTSYVPLFSEAKCFVSEPNINSSFIFPRNVNPPHICDLKPSTNITCRLPLLFRKQAVLEKKVCTVEFEEWLRPSLNGQDVLNSLKHSNLTDPSTFYLEFFLEEDQAAQSLYSRWQMRFEIVRINTQSKSQSREVESPIRQVGGAFNLRTALGGRS